jgi:hypothetical protein
MVANILFIGLVESRDALTIGVYVVGQSAGRLAAMWRRE